MQMIKMRSLEEYDHMPLTAWKIKQPTDDGRFSNEEALATGEQSYARLLLFIVHI